MEKLLLTWVIFFVVACSATKPVARTLNDAARVACEVAFGEEELPQGMTPEQMCDAHEDLQPFIRQILAAKNTVGAAHGLKMPEEAED